MDGEKKYRKCFYYEMGNMLEIEKGHVHFCIPEEAKTIEDRLKMKKPIDPEMCETCERFKSRFIEIPLTIKGLELRKPEYWDISLEPVRIRPCDEEKTYFGVYLGQFPRYLHASFEEDTGRLEVSSVINSCIFVPELGQLVFGDESWWSRISPGEDIKDITNETINGQWYMRLLRDMASEKGWKRTMEKAELLKLAKPILFNTEMVRAILNGRKTVTRLAMKPQPKFNNGFWEIGRARWSDGIKVIHPAPGHSLYNRMPYKPKDYLYVKETWGIYPSEEYGYKADYIGGCLSGLHPSIHMPKEAARIFLRVTSVRVEMLQEITEEGAESEGAINTYGFIVSPEDEYAPEPHTAIEGFESIWDSTIKPKDRDKYSWAANPWVWVIEFERVGVQE